MKVRILKVQDDGGVAMYLGIVDFWVFLAYLLVIIVTVICVVYGVVNWNRNGSEITPEDLAWAKDEDKISDDL